MAFQEFLIKKYEFLKLYNRLFRCINRAFQRLLRGVNAPDSSSRKTLRGRERDELINCTND
jgi:hypothetical protein